RRKLFDLASFTLFFYRQLHGQPVKPQKTGFRNKYRRCRIKSLPQILGDYVKKAEDKSTVWIRGDKESVWRAITDAEKLTEWYAPGSSWEIPKLEPGEKVTFTLKPNKQNELQEELPMTLTIKNVVPYEEFSLYVDMHEILLTFKMKEDDHGFEMEINSGGFDESLANLKALVEGEKLP